MTRGFAAIGLHQPKDPSNVGSAIRAAMAYGVASVAIEGARGRAAGIRHKSDTSAAWRHLPVLRGELSALVPFGAQAVAVDLVEGAVPLPSFAHPPAAFYVFGPEDGTLGPDVLAWCAHRVMIPTRICMNLAATVNVVLYDRMSKRPE